MLLGLSATLASQAGAVDKCKVKVDKKTGVVRVAAKGVTGTLLWGDAQGSETNPFFNAATCVASGKAKKCELADPTTLASKTPPAACTLYLADDGSADCSVWIRGCTPAATNLPCASQVGNDVFFDGCNVHVRSGSGATDGSVNGLGNLIVGYDEDNGDTKTGSHNLVIGRDHTYNSYGGLVAGLDNAVTAPSASVIGGRANTASGDAASVSGGFGNKASGVTASVSGGNTRSAPSNDDWAAGLLFQDF